MVHLLSPQKDTPPPKQKKRSAIEVISMIRICLLSLVAYLDVTFAKWLVPPSCAVLNGSRAWISPTKGCNTHLQAATNKDFPFYWMIADPDRNVVVTGVPKAGITSTRSLLNKRCRSNAADDRCAEFRRNSSLSKQINTTLRAMMLRDPADRVAAAWRDLPSNRFINAEFAPHGCLNTSTCSFPRFVEILNTNWNRIGGNEHLLPQHRIARAHLMQYHFIGLLNNDEDLAIYWNVILNSPDVVRIHQTDHTSTKPFTKAEISTVWPIIWKLYADDYTLIRSLGYAAPSDPQTPSRRFL